MNRFALLTQMLKESPNDLFLLYALALEKHKVGNMDEAVSDLQKLLQNNPDYLAAYYQLGKFYEAQGEIAKAVQIYKDGIPVAKKQVNSKTLGELRSALLQLTDDQD